MGAAHAAATTARVLVAAAALGWGIAGCDLMDEPVGRDAVDAGRRGREASRQAHSGRRGTTEACGRVGVREGERLVPCASRSFEIAV